jgi:hypothetical protein
MNALTFFGQDMTIFRRHNNMLRKLLLHVAITITIAFNANGIWRQRYELSKQLQYLHIDVALLLETRPEPNEKFFNPNYHFYRTDRFPGRTCGTAVALRKGIPHNHVDLSPFFQ